MRITAFMLYNQFADSLSKNLSNMSRVQTQLATGKRLTKPSDDVIALRGSMAYKVSINNIEQFNRNIDEGIGALGVTESALSSTTNLLNRARELAISQSSDTATAGTRDVSSFEIRNLFSELVDIGNSKLKDKYLFSGFLSNTPSFDAAGAYQGDSNNVEIHIGEGIRGRINVAGDVAFSDTTKLATSDTVDLDGEDLSGNLQITSGGGTPLYLHAGDVFTNTTTPEEIRDTINAPMTGAYAAAAEIGTGTLTLQAGNGSPVTLTVSGPPVAPGDPPQNNTPELLRDAINGLNMGITAGIFRDAANNQQLFFRPTSSGEAISVDVANDADNNDVDLNGLSALLLTDLKSNLMTNALGVEAFVIDDGTNKRMIFEPDPANTTFTIEVSEDGDTTFSEAGPPDETDATGLSLLHHTAATSNLTNNNVSFFSILNHFANSLSTNDSTGVEASIHFLDGALDSVVNTSADIGARLKYVMEQKDRLQGNEISYKESLSALEDADIAEVAMEITKIQSTLDAMRISSVQSLSKSLFDFLG
jgi:flagellar hook-associated protein 3